MAERAAVRTPTLAPAARPARPRLAVVHDTDGPRVRLGLAWFAAVTAAAAASRPMLALLLAGAAAAAADELVRLRADAGPTAGGDVDAQPLPASQRVAGLLADPRRLPAALGAAAVPLAAAVGTDTLAAALPAVVLVVLVHRLLVPGAGSAVVEASVASLVALGIGLAAAAPVLLVGVGPAAAVGLLVLVSAYDAGDYLVGTGSSTVWEGPAAGVAATVVVGFAAAVVALPPFDLDAWLALTLLTALLAPLGPPAGSVLLGDGRRRARFVRRLDSLLVAGPVAAWAAATLLAS